MSVTVNQSLILVGTNYFITWVTQIWTIRKLDFAPLLEAYAYYYIDTLGMNDNFNRV